MKRIISLGAGCALATALVMTASPARAQVPPQVTLTFTLTLNGTVPAHDSFSVLWAENGIVLCNPCTGNGHVYKATMLWPTGSTRITFVFARFGVTPAGTIPSPKQKFGQQTVVPTANRTVSAFYTYGTAATAITTPTTGGAPVFGIAAALLAAGGGTGLLAVRLRRRSSRQRRATVG
ncbi:MAG TPA: hypothetical protein VII79_08270 [Candidatus Dormibacteraeota bacterium]